VRPARQRVLDLVATIDALAAGHPGEAVAVDVAIGPGDDFAMLDRLREQLARTPYRGLDVRGVVSEGSSRVLSLEFRRRA
jgi:hypothetical protein